MSALLVHMRRVLGEEAANATVARNVLAAVTSKLPSGGGEPDLHRRCVLFDCAPSRVRVDEVCAALAPSGGGGAVIEAVALCGYFVAAVVVFRTAAGAESALRGPARRSCHAVPPLDLGVEIPFIGPTDVKIIMPDSPILESCTPPPPEPEPKPWIEFLDCPSAEAACGTGTKQFDPSCESLVHGPTRGADGSLWMYGDITSADGRDVQMGASIRVRQTDPPPKDKRRPGIPDTAIWFRPF
uniref:Uncharacterized protein n=1 Tax=Setaria italica TaxID=4555 RepID=K3Y259_SETIT